MADQEFLASFAVDIDEAGVARLQSILMENRELADSLASAFCVASEAIHSFAEELGILPDFSGRGIVTEGLAGFNGLAVGLNLSQAFTDYESFTALVKQPISLNANAAGIVSAARSAMSNVRSIFSSPVTIRVNAEQDGGEGGVISDTPIRMSTGGRFSRPTDVQVAEDGDAEYIIPVKKEKRALPLIRQMLGEMSPEVRERVALSESGKDIQSGMTDQPIAQVCQAFDSLDYVLPLSGNASAGKQTVSLERFDPLPKLGDLLSASLHEMAPPVMQSMNQNVMAPVNIQVHSSGANAEQVGQRIYDTAERYLLRTLKGAMP